MNSLDTIRAKLQRLYKTDPHIRINVALTNPKINLKNEQVTITGIYPHIFQIEERSSGSPKHALNKAFSGVALLKLHFAKEVRIESKIAFRRELRAFWREFRREQTQNKTQWQYTQDELQADKLV